MTLPKELTTVTLASRIVELIVLVAAMIISFGLGVNYQETIDLLKQQNNPQPTTMNKPITQPINETVYTEPNRSASWKTYTDEKYSFQFKHPPEWVIASKLDNALEDTARYIALIDSLLAESAVPVFAIHVKPNSPYSKELTKAKASIGKGEENDVVISGVDGKKYSTLGPVTAPGPEKLSTYVLPFNKGSFLITIAPEQKNKNYSAAINQILSTFKFTNP